jgi:tRNA (guanine10-N2)-methyltransferase
VRCLYDAIVTDPPYGIRAGARKAGSRRETVRPVDVDLRASHIPQTQPYNVEDVLVDLLDLAAQTLTLEGRLVYLLPTTYDFTDADLPVHPCLTLVANSEQAMTQKIGRRLITMQKSSDYDPSLRASYQQASSSSAERPFAKLRERIAGDTLSGSLDKRERKKRRK